MEVPAGVEDAFPCPACEAPVRLPAFAAGPITAVIVGVLAAMGQIVPLIVTWTLVVASSRATTADRALLDVARVLAVIGLVVGAFVFFVFGRVTFFRVWL